MLGALLILTTVVLAVLKLAGVLTISWLLVFLPVFAGFVMLVVALIAAIAIALITA